MGKSKSNNWHCEVTCKGSRLLIAPSSAEELLAYIRQRRFSRLFLVTDQTVFSQHGDNFLQKLREGKSHPIDCFVIESGETSKTLASAEKCWQQMHLCKMDRASLLISLGGGVVTDLAGFAASCYMRGIDLVHIPTTLLAMVDASIGGKTGVNLPTGKNLVGTFYQPSAVLIDPAYLSTLPKREFASGMAEVIKYAVIRDPLLFDFLEKNMEQILSLDSKALLQILSSSCRIKSAIVEEDEKEKGIRAILNYGHTFAHALETFTQYSSYLHGEAVAIGICCAADAALRMGLIDSSLVERQETLCKKAGLPTQIKVNIDPEKIVQLMAADKKAIAGNLQLILPTKIGDARPFDNIASDFVVSVLEGRRS